MNTAIVTGATSGIGEAVAEVLISRGYHVIGTSRDSSSVADPIPGVDYRDLDLTDPASIRRFVDGIADAQTSAAIEGYQSFAALRVDGVASSALLEELRGVTESLGTDAESATSEATPPSATAANTAQALPPPRSALRRVLCMYTR